MKSVLLVGFAAAALAQTFPDGPGKAETERMCKGCHPLENVTRSRRTKDKWTEVVDNMVSRGAKGTDDEIELVIEYLSAHFGPQAAVKVNVNKASSAELAAGLEIPARDAEAIVRYRTENGAFKTVQDLSKVPGIDAKRIESVQDRIEF
jgi:competence ComEA-like helix-hairpin-helix protein